ncbi:hypothetical protein [Olleya sp. HaHaR_3_96]|uniref:hypothetical protein n=1 Tax=Olleya sp. HaHaR_3_96 TaxID=2745560 RepID=UPI001C4E401F|nr:hypothetical protein [Olleya sp. HaHaR_3_96]QXP59346.1 hypothetical protein H0I26_15685 [Olleya sp. HaHaR_3_96]
MIQRLFLILICFSLFTCTDDLSGFEGQWQCNDANGTIYTFSKINRNAYLMQWGENNYITGKVTAKGVFETPNALFAIDFTLNQLILPENWACQKAIKLSALPKENSVIETKTETINSKLESATPVEDPIKEEASEIDTPKILDITIGNTKVPENIANLIANETVVYDCLIKKQTTEAGFKLISVDFIQLKKAEASNQSFYQIVNSNPKLRTFLITDKTTFLPSELSFEALENFVTSDDDGQVFKISTRKGLVISLTKTF